MGDLLEVGEFHLELLCLWVVKRSLEHQGCIRQKVHAFSISKIFWPIPRELFTKFLHDSINLLAFTWNSKSIQENLESIKELNTWIGEVKLVNVA